MRDKRPFLFVGSLLALLAALLAAFLVACGESTPPASAPTQETPAPPASQAPAGSSQSSPTGTVPADVHAAIRSQLFGKFRRCYETGLQANAKLEGRVVVKFVIDKDRKVTTANADEASTLPDASVRSCVADVLKTVTLAPGEFANVTVTFPLVLRPPSDGKKDPAMLTEEMTATKL